MAIQGLKLTMTSDELKKTMLDRIKYHKDKSDFLEREIKRLEPELSKFGEEAEAQGKYANSGGPGGNLNGFKSSLAHHVDRVTLFKFMAEHVIPNETYILDENDLRKLEVLPSW